MSADLLESAHATDELVSTRFLCPPLAKLESITESPRLDPPPNTPMSTSAEGSGMSNLDLTRCEQSSGSSSSSAVTTIETKPQVEEVATEQLPEIQNTRGCAEKALPTAQAWTADTVLDYITLRRQARRLPHFGPLVATRVQKEQPPQPDGLSLPRIVEGSRRTLADSPTVTTRSLRMSVARRQVVEVRS